MTAFARLALLAGFLACQATSAWAVIEAEGVSIDESVVINGQKLVLNGYGVRKRGYFKTELTALYLPQRTNSAEVVYKTNAPRYVRQTILRDLPAAVASRFFIREFTMDATEAEAKQLVTELGAIGGLYGNINRINKGDVVELFWNPGQGMNGKYNGKWFDERYITNPLWWAVYMRGFVGPNVAESFRNGILGLNGSAASNGSAAANGSNASASTGPSIVTIDPPKAR